MTTPRKMSPPCIARRRPETEIARLASVVDAARAIARMRHPSIEKLLRARGFGYEADRVAELVRAVDEAFKPAPENDAD
jgi:hypothetical protein